MMSEHALLCLYHHHQVCQILGKKSVREQSNMKPDDGERHMCIEESSPWSEQSLSHSLFLGSCLFGGSGLGGGEMAERVDGSERRLRAIPCPMQQLKIAQLGNSLCVLTH
jgi:hypothetical protein